MKLIVALVLSMAMLAGAAPPETAPKTAPVVLTKDRNTPEALAAMVAGPIALMEEGDTAGGLKAFEDLVVEKGKRHGENSIEVADLLAAFGIALHDRDDVPLATSYLRRAAAVMKAVYGPRHPEVALAITDIAMAQWTDPGVPPPLEVDEALREAYDIRLATLGPDHPETAWNLGRLATLAGLPSRIDGRPERVEAAVVLGRRAIDALRVGLDPEHPDAVALAYVDLAEVYVRNKRLHEGLRAFADATREFEQIEPRAPGLTIVLVTQAADFADLLEAFGHGAEAEVIRRRYPDPLRQGWTPKDNVSPNVLKWTI